MLVDADGYGRSQFIDGWIDVMDGLTPRSEIVDFDADDAALTAAGARLATGPLVVKGLGKSAKDDWADSMFVAHLDDLHRVVANLRARISVDAEERLVIREFVPLLGDELRLWWVDGTCRAVRNHPQSAPGAVDEKGRWWLVEVGSGCVSELPAGLAVDDLFPDNDG